jgi:hypothetical protein
VNSAICLRKQPIAITGILILVGLCWPLGSQAGRVTNDANSFNGYSMESPLSHYPSLTRIESRVGEFVRQIGIYEDRAETIIVNDVSFSRVRYRFADTKLESIQLVYQGRDNRERLRQWLEDTYGKLPARERPMVNQVEWHGDRMVITLSFNGALNQGSLWFTSPDLHRNLHESRAPLSD